jgi:hypothetical protein
MHIETLIQWLLESLLMAAGIAAGGLLTLVVGG